MVLVIKNLVHSVVTPRSDTAILVLDSNPNSNLIIQDQILDLDQSKISPTKVIPSLNLDVEDRDKEDPLSFQTLSDKGIVNVYCVLLWALGPIALLV